MANVGRIFRICIINSANGMWILFISEWEFRIAAGSDLLVVNSN
ncbi:MAG: hypothetical protein JWO03_576 [Bacteroidetes bacterium]|nr:hypothetical protein [Bacteroidota bacterium]